MLVNRKTADEAAVREMLISTMEREIVFGHVQSMLKFIDIFTHFSKTFQQFSADPVLLSEFSGNFMTTESCNWPSKM